MSKASETETVIKKIIPYLIRRGYDLNTDFTFEYATPGTERSTLGFIDILVKRSGKIAFLVEAKRISKPLSAKDRAQAIEYGKSVKAPFVILTNGAQFESLNTANTKRILWNGKLSDKVPSKAELQAALTALRKDPQLIHVPLSGDTSLPFRPGLPLKQLNALFSRCHNVIRKIERNEDHAFADFAKLLFLKLLEEKSDTDGKPLPYSFRFHELNAKPESESDQVKTAILSMIAAVKSQTPFGDVIRGELYLKHAKTFKYIVSELASVSFRDSRTDSKGAAFEYFVRATLKGKKLGQYFTPRPLIELMHSLVGREKILTSLQFNGKMKVVDPTCGTGGFLVYLMLAAIEQVNAAHASGKLNAANRTALVQKIREQVFFGSDAHEGVASSAKMNMIIAGDGHTNIRCEDSLSVGASVWSVDKPEIDLIITNPPFGTSETESLGSDDLGQFPVKGARGQILFVQKMVQATRPGGEICTVIDEGLLNTEQAAELRQFIMQQCTILGIIRLPEVTFKPNKITVKSSVMHLQKRDEPIADLDDEYMIPFIDIYTLGYDGTGESIRNVSFETLNAEIEKLYHSSEMRMANGSGSNNGFRWYNQSSLAIASDATNRFDFKYWEPELIAKIETLEASDTKSIKDINTIKTRRGKSPNSSMYVDEVDGYALVIKAGTNISKQGTVIIGGDFIEKNVYDDLSKAHVCDGDVLLSSTGDGTLGKCAVYRGSLPAVIDSHVTLIRVNQEEIYPEYVCDYIRAGFGAAQVARFFTGSTGLIELPADQVDRLMVPLPSRDEQVAISTKLRAAESTYQAALGEAQATMVAVQAAFRAL